ncbi:MAG: hypothetical protein HYV26_09735 [Candidatus Hydrogenedentes bacterium]|nr:hypothetical protein [Candidatus Hydrogenedentota bacterium]MBI3118926.1 hypothetical protein [Candidatus Hydrogenedentota bacterium]
MVFIRTFKGYEDKTLELDNTINQWILQQRVKVVDIKPSLSHESGARSGSGDLLYTVLYEAEKPLP